MTIRHDTQSPQLMTQRTNMDSQPIRRPLERIRMKALCVRAAAQRPPAKSPEDGVERDGGAPVEGAADDVVASDRMVGGNGEDMSTC